MKNERLVLLYKSTKNAQIAVKSSSGISERRTIHDIIMQGTVWSSLMCTSTMDELGKISYNDPYKYKGMVDVPIIGMVDDVVSVVKCSNKSISYNATVKTFMDSVNIVGESD